MIEQFVANILLLLLGSLVTMLICHRLKFPLIVAYILVGIILGPFGFKVIHNNVLIMNMAEFGLVFLLFSIGLEFSLKRLFASNISVLLLALGQLIFTAGVSSAIGMYVGMTLTQSVLIGAVIAMSSTAVVIKQLKDQNELNLEHSPFIVSILLMQDIAVIPALMFVTHPSYVSIQGGILLTSTMIFLKSISAVILILLFGKYVLRPIFHWIHQQSNREIFMVAALLVAIGFSWMTHMLGMSWILGGFIAGIILAETEFRTKLEHEIRPFRDILMGLFFITVGSQLNLQDVTQYWQWILLMLSGIIIAKFLVIFLLGMIINKNKILSLRTALCLAQGGEFGFAILILAMNQRIYPVEYGQVMLASLLLSMILATFIIRYNSAIAHFAFKKK